MRSDKRARTFARAAVALEQDVAAEAAQDDEIYDIYRVTCPDCGQPIALLAEEENLPEHALCASPWNPFGLTVCQGSGRAAADAAPARDDGEAEHGLTALLTLPESLDWRTQPFSHVGGPRTRSLVSGA
ncbi:hypothetical protein K378_05691 [Streptomyces sp. Amel2xB2]|uniref:hypothetical protein n=1 Tax=Streptomyces sp. Amel2xB2 TaxID=1305829 RepID=UPI000DBA783A|nr:hypothetical protein [Streptomyces sp. Amel2xB2]RAJ56504.1 hypothetical protein K378_05691 [Streptomyces sp. Amel2xB2]